MSKLTFVFVHGLSGWGSYDAAYQRMPNVRLCLRETLPADLELALDADGDCHPVSEKNSAHD